MPASHPRPGFTLIELLVVVAILAVLSAMVLSVIGLVRDSARSVDCVSKLRQLGVATEAYAGDNRGMCYQAQVSYAPFGSNWDIDPFWGMWPGRIMPYLVSNFRGSTATFDGESWNRYFNCPSGNWTTHEIKALYDQGLGHGLSCVWTTSYGMNGGWLGRGVPYSITTSGATTYTHYRMATAKSASTTILLGEKWGVADNSSPALPDDRAGCDWPTTTNGRIPVPADWPRKTAAPSPASGSASIRQSHHGRMSLLFMDLHAGSHRLAETWNGTNSLTTGSWWAGLP